MRKTLIAVRIEAKTLAKIDQLAGKREYLTRSGVINMLLDNLFEVASNNLLEYMADYWLAYEDASILTLVFKNKTIS